MREVRVSAPAKVNLGLRVLDRRPDGYHRIESLFVPLDLCDRLHVRVVREPGSAEAGGPPSGGTAPAVSLVLEGLDSAVPGGADNLAARAAAAFLERSGLAAGLHIRLHKRIPSAAGLGGGSSDAAAVLRALAGLFPGALTDATARGLALELGADVPYFLAPRPALVSGIGEVVEAAPGLPALPLLLAHPGIPLATARVYAAYDELGAALTPGGAGPTFRELPALLGASASERERLQAFLRALRESGSGSPLLRNDLEPAAVRLCPAIATLREEIQGVGAAGTGLSGSGPTVYGIFDSAQAAQEAQRHLVLAPPARSWVVTSTASS